MRSLSKVVKSRQIVLGSPVPETAFLQTEDAAAEQTRQEAAAARDSLGDAAYSVLQGARAQAGKILDEAKRAALQMYEQAKRQGAEAGRFEGLGKGAEEGRRQAQQEEQAAVCDLETLLDRCETRRQELERQSCEQSLDFAFGLAEKILGIEIDRRDEAFLGLCREAAGRMGKAETVTLRVGPRGYEIAKRHEEELREMMGGLTQLRLEPSEQDAGACILETPQGSVDAGVSTRLARARAIAGV
jgi:flagellar assembly protein FliH